MTTDDLKNALEFAASTEHDGDIRMILCQAKHACRTLAKEVERLRAENAELSKRPAGLSDAAIGAACCYDYFRRMDEAETAEEAREHGRET